jgi:hypothetical protein
MELKALHTRVPVCRRVHVRVRIFVHSLAIILLLFYVQYPIRVQLYVYTRTEVERYLQKYESTKVQRNTYTNSPTVVRKCSRTLYALPDVL